MIKNNNAVEIHIAFSTAGLKKSVATYRVYPDGRLYVFHSAVPTKGMLRFGYQMTMDKSMEYITWYGRGPKPTYIDRKLGCVVISREIDRVIIISVDLDSKAIFICKSEISYIASVR